MIVCWIRRLLGLDCPSCKLGTGPEGGIRPVVCGLKGNLILPSFSGPWPWPLGGRGSPEAGAHSAPRGRKPLVISPNEASHFLTSKWIWKNSWVWPGIKGQRDRRSLMSITHIFTWFKMLQYLKVTILELSKRSFQTQPSLTFFNWFFFWSYGLLCL